MCSDFQHGQCLNTADTCPFAHPQPHCPLDTDGLVIVCVDYVKGKCAREVCKYFHPPDHLVAQLKAVKAQSVAAAAAHVYSAAATAASFQYAPSTIQLVQPLTLSSNQPILTASPTTYVYPQQTSSIAPASSSPLVCFCIALHAFDIVFLNELFSFSLNEEKYLIFLKFIYEF